MNKSELRISPENINRPQYKFTTQGSLLFLTGVPLSGKSTIAPLMASSIENCSLQNMDIIRLLAQERENLKPLAERNRFVTCGSCDSYTLVGDGIYSPSALVEGFLRYSEAVTSLLDKVIPNLESQGAQQVIFEGVQITPNLIEKFLTGNNQLIVITSSKEKLLANGVKMFAGNEQLLSRYSSDRLMVLQEELLRQSEEIHHKKVIFVDNTSEPSNAVASALTQLLESQIIAKI